MIFPASFPPVLGGVQVVSSRLASHLASRGATVEVLTRRYPRGLPRTEEIDGVAVTRGTFFPSAADSLRRARLDLALASILTRMGDRRETRKVLVRLDPDVVNIHFPDWQVGLIPLIQASGNVRLVVSLHGDEVMRAVRNGGGQRSRLITALRKADWVTACSDWLLERAASLEPGIRAKSSVAWNGIDTARYAAPAAVKRARPYVIGFGRFVPKKGFDLLIKAFAGVSKDHDLLLVGSGPEQARLSQLAVQEGVSNRVVFPGRATSDEMIRWIQGATAVVVPSREEPFGMAALEVVAAGVPLVATSVGGMAEFLGPIAARSASVQLCPPEVGPIRTALSTVMEGGESGAAEADTVRRDFDWSRRLEAYTQVLI